MNFIRSLIFVTLFVQCFCDDWSAPCNRTRCTCKWMNGKKSALCNNGEHTHVPATLSTDLQVLSLNENNIGYLNRDEFHQNGLEHLQRIFIKNSRVQHVHREAFKNLKILVEIDLSENSIETLEPGTFTGNDRLRILYLYGNPLKRLSADQFPTLPHLRTLDLHDCTLQSIHERAFLRVDQLEYLNLQNNSLSTLEPNVLAHLHLLKTLILGDNPWDCDCKLRDFRNWYVATNYPRLSCVLPTRHAGSEWDNVSADLFGCLPSVHLVADHNVQAEDIGPTNASFHCLVSGDPVPQIAWELNGNPLSEGYNVVVETGVLWSNLTILNVTNYDSGTYSCRAWNLVGEVDQNATLFLPEVVEHVIVKTHETFWYFGLIVGTFGTVFGLLLVSVTVCYCRKAALQRNTRRRHQQKKQQQQRMGGQGAGGCNNGRLKGSVSFTEREKRLLDLSLTNDRMDSCEMVNTPSTTITLNNSVSVGYTQHKVVDEQQQQREMQMEREANNEEFPLNVQLFPPPPAEFSCGINGGPGAAAATHAHLYATQGLPGEPSGGHHPSNQYLATTTNNNNNQGCEGGGYGNIYISVSVTKDPDLLNIPNRINSTGDNTSEEGTRNNMASIRNSITNNQNNNIIILNGGGGGPDSDHNNYYHQQQQQQQQDNLNNIVNYSSFRGTQQDTAYCLDGSGIAGLLSPPLSHQQQQHHQNVHAIDWSAPQGQQPYATCAFATLPRNPRHPQFYSNLRTGPQYQNGGGVGGSGNAGSCGGQVTPIVINNFNIASLSNAIQFKELPPTIHEHEQEQAMAAYQNLEASGATLTRPMGKIRGIAARDGGLREVRSANKFHGYSHSPPVDSGGGGGGKTGNGGGGEQVIVTNCPTNYDNIGRRITASGNSPFKVPEADDTESGKALSSS